MSNQAPPPVDPLEGKTGFQKSTGRRVVRKGGQWVPIDAGKPAPQEASMRGRMDLGLAPMVQAQSDMAAAEHAAGANPLNKDWGAAMLDGVDIPIPFTNGSTWSPFDAIAQKWGGQDFQNYTQAAKTFESQLMPIMSGSAVSASEAARQIKASLPALGNSTETLDNKARTRAMMLNGAAKARNLPLPYPDVPTWGINTSEVPDGGAAPDGLPNYKSKGWSEAATPQQLRAAQMYRGAKAKIGTKGNPFVPTSTDEFESLPVGSSFINPADGRVLTKAH